MKRSIYKPLLLITLLSGLTALSNAQSIIGSWKKADEVLLKGTGKTSSTFKMMVKNMPCFGDIVYTFSAGGIMDETAKGCNVALQKQVEAEVKNTHWKMTGSKVVMDISNKTSPVLHAEYYVEFVGQNEMVWTFIYAENPGVPNITKAKQMKTTYKRSAG